MATNIEQIFRSFVVSKFREIQEQQFGGVKLGSQHNGEINSSEEVNSLDDTITSIGNLQNDPLVQKIEQVLSEVLGAEPPYKPDSGEDSSKNKPRSEKRGFSEEVEDEVPRKKSKKDKKHKDKKKKKKRRKEKKEKKYKKQPKELTLNTQDKECDDIASVLLQSKIENSVSILNSEGVDIRDESQPKQVSEQSVEKTVHESVNLVVSDSCNALSSDISTQDTSGEDSMLIGIQELYQERELENDDSTNLAVNLSKEGDSADVEEGAVCMIRSGEASAKEKEPAAPSDLEAPRKVDESSLKSVAMDVRYFETSLGPDAMKIKDFDSFTETLNSENIEELESTSLETGGCKLMNPYLEAVAEGKDSVTTLGFLAMVVGKDFEATSEFLNTAKIKASERSPKHSGVTDVKDDLECFSEKVAMVKDLQKKQPFETLAELKDLEAAPGSLCASAKRDFGQTILRKPEFPQEDLKRSVGSDAQESIEAAPDVETTAVMTELRETQASEIIMRKDSEKYPGSQQIVAGAKDFRKPPMLDVTDKTSPGLSFADVVKMKAMEAASELRETDTSSLKQDSESRREVETSDAVARQLRNFYGSLETKGEMQMENSSETVVGEEKNLGLREDLETVIRVKVPENISKTEAVLKGNDLEVTPKIVKDQDVEVSKFIDTRDIKTKKDLKDVTESLNAVKEVENIPDTECIDQIKNMKDILQSDAVAHKKSMDTNLEPDREEEEKEIEQEEKEMDSTSDSLHMIFTNYSEHSLELYTEPEISMELQSSETIPALLHTVDANNLKTLHVEKVDDFKTLESERKLRSTDLQEIISPGRDLKPSSQSLHPVNYSEEAITKDKKIENASHVMSERGVKASENIIRVGKDQDVIEAMETLSSLQKMTTVVPKAVSQNQSEGLPLISKTLLGMNVMSSEVAPKIVTVTGIQGLKETVGFSNAANVGDLKEPYTKRSTLVDLKDDSTYANTIKCFESITESPEVKNLDPSQCIKTKFREESLEPLDYAEHSPEFLFSDEVNNQTEKHKLKEAAEATSSVSPESLYVSDLIIVPESDESSKVKDPEHGSKSIYLAETNFQSTLKSFYMIEVKDSEVPSESKIIDVKDMAIDSGSTIEADIEITGDHAGCESVVATEILEIDSLPQNEVLLESQCMSVLQESGAAFEGEILTITDLGSNSETICVIDLEHLERSPQCEELGTVKNLEVAPPSLFSLDIKDIKAVPALGHTIKDKELENKTADILANMEKPKTSEGSVGILEGTFELSCITDIKELEASQKLETDLELLGEKEINSVQTEPSQKTYVSGSSTFQRCEPWVDMHVSEGMLINADKAEGRRSETNLKQDAELIAYSSETVSESRTATDREAYCRTVSVLMLDLRDSEANSSVLDTGKVKHLKTDLPFEAPSEPLQILESEDSALAEESLVQIETKNLKETQNETQKVKVVVAAPTQFITPELKSFELNAVRTLELKTTPSISGASDLKASESIAASESLQIIDSEEHPKSQKALEVKHFESTSESEDVMETYHYSAASETKVKALKTASGAGYSTENLESLPEPKTCQKLKHSECHSQSVCAGDIRDLNSNLYEKMVEISEDTSQNSNIVEVKDLGAGETTKDSEKHLHFEEKYSETTLEHIRDVHADVESVSLSEESYPKPTSDVKNLEGNSGFMNIVEQNDTEQLVKGKDTLESVHANESEDFEASTKAKFLGDVEDVQLAEKSVFGKMKQMNFEEVSKSALSLEKQDLDKDSTSVLHKETSEVSLQSVQAASANNSVSAPGYTNTNVVNISEQKLVAENMVETNTENMKMISQFTTEEKDSGLELLCVEKEKNTEIILEEEGFKLAPKPACIMTEENLKANHQILQDKEAVVKPVCAPEENLTPGQSVIVEIKDSEVALETVHIVQEKNLEATVQNSLNNQGLESAQKSLEVMKEKEESTVKDKKSEKTSSKSKDKSRSAKKAKKSRSKSPSKTKKRKKKSRSRSTSRQAASRRARSRSKNDSSSKKKYSTSRHKSRSKSVDKKDNQEPSVRSRRRRSRSLDRKSRSKSVDKRETSVRSRRRRSRSSDHHKSRSRSVDRRESSRRRRRLSRSSDKHKSRSRSTDRRETLVRSRRRRSRSSDHHKSRSRSADKRETSVRTRRRRSKSSDRYKSRSKSRDRRESSVRTRRRRSKSSDHRKSRSRSADDKRTRRRRSRSPDTRRSRSRSVDRRESPVRSRRRRSRSLDNRKSRSRSVDKRESSVRTRRRRSRSSDKRKSRSRSVDKRESSVRGRRRRSRSSDKRKSRSRSVDKRESPVRSRRRRSRSSDNRKSRSRSVDKRESSVRGRRRQSRSSDRKSRSKSVDRRETPVRPRRRRSVSSDCKSRSKSVDRRESSVRTKKRRSRSSSNRKSRSKSVENIEASRSKRKRSKSADNKYRTKSAEKEELSLKSKRRRSKSSDRPMSKSKSRSKTPEKRKDRESSDRSGRKLSKSRSKSKSLEKTVETNSLETPACNRTKSPDQRKSKSRSKSRDKTGEKENLRRSRSKGSKSPEPSRRRRTASRSRRNRSRSVARRRTSRSKSDDRSRSRTRSRSCSRRWRRTRSRSLSRQRSLSRERRRRSRRNRSRSTDRRRRRSDSRDSYRIPLRLRSRSRTPARLRSTGRRRSTSISPDHRRSRSSSRSPKRLTDLDKAQLLEIAKANAAAMCAKAGVPLPPSLIPVIVPEKKEEKVIQKSAKETILELTEKCKKIAQSQEDDVIVNKPHVSDEEEEEHPFINHPFKLSEPKPIFFNLTTPTIKPAAPKNQVTLTKEFPVSSGSQHRKKEADSAYGEWVPVEKNKDENKDDVFPNPANLEPVDISSALNERTIAQKRLTENTFDMEAMCLLNRAQERIDAWAQLNSIPGHFTGSTGAQVLTSEQLSNSGPQAWIKKDQFLRAAPVTGGMGAQLMRKMGWREGEGLGKNKEGNKEPILVDFKTDRKGLVAVGEKTQKRHGPFSAVKDLSGKHPVSALLEVCNKRRWSPPIFVLANDNRPEHHKHFVFKVMVNGVEYKPNTVSPNKKHAKAMAATVALQALGLVPKDLLANATNFRSASHN